MTKKVLTGPLNSTTNKQNWGWLGRANMSCILRHWDVQVILPYSWARPAILETGKGRGECFIPFLRFHSFSSFFPVNFFHLLCYLFFVLSPVLCETTQDDPQGFTRR